MYDREPAARIHQQLHLGLAAIEEHKHVTCEWVVSQYLAHFVRQPLE